MRPAVLLKGQSLVSLRLAHPELSKRYLAVTSVYDPKKALRGYAVEPKVRADRGDNPGGTGFHYTPPPSGHCPAASPLPCPHLFLDRLSASFTRTSLPKHSAVEDKFSEAPFTLTPLATPGSVLSAPPPSPGRLVLPVGFHRPDMTRHPSAVSVHLRAVDPSTLPAWSGIQWPSGTWGKGSASEVVLEWEAYPGWVLSVGSPSQGAQLGTKCEDVGQGGECMRAAARGMCHDNTDTKLLKSCARSCGMCDATQLSLILINPLLSLPTMCGDENAEFAMRRNSTKTDKPSDLPLARNSVSSRRLFKAENQDGHDSNRQRNRCINKYHAANDFLSKTSFVIEEGLVSSYPLLSFFVPATSEDVMSDILVASLNKIVDEMYTVYYILNKY